MNIGGVASAAAAAAKQAAIEAARKAAIEAAKKAAAEAAAKKAAEAQAKAAAAKPEPKSADAAETKSQNIADVAQAVAAAADPLARIEQVHGKHTCAAAGKQEAMREKDPAGYDKMVKDLKEKGESQMPNGQKIHLSEKNREYIEKQDCSEADKENMRVQAALMDYANETEEYDMEQDHSINAEGITHQGLTEDQMAKLDKLDESTHTADAGKVEVAATVIAATTGIFGSGKSHAEALADQLESLVETAQENGKQVQIALDLGDGGKHSYAVTDVNDAADTVTVRDASGEKTISQEAFDKGVTSEEGDVGESGGGMGTSGGLGARQRPRPAMPYMGVN
jgi:hypothetical protein